MIALRADSVRVALEAASTQHGTSLAQLSFERPVLAVFLRHFG
ncbi:MAG: hypothetical protein ACKO4Q_15250 [Planctomycetota bacterium]